MHWRACPAPLNVILACVRRCQRNFKESMGAGRLSGSVNRASLSAYSKLLPLRERRFIASAPSAGVGASVRSIPEPEPKDGPSITQSAGQGIPFVPSSPFWAIYFQNRAVPPAYSNGPEAEIDTAAQEVKFVGTECVARALGGDVLHSVAHMVAGGRLGQQRHANFLPRSVSFGLDCCSSRSPPLIPTDPST